MDTLIAELAQIKAPGMISTGYQAEMGIGATNMARIQGLYDLRWKAESVRQGRSMSQRWRPTRS